MLKLRFITIFNYFWGNPAHYGDLRTDSMTFGWHLLMRLLFLKRHEQDNPLPYR